MESHCRGAPSLGQTSMARRGRGSPSGIQDSGMFCQDLQVIVGCFSVSVPGVLALGFVLASMGTYGGPGERSVVGRTRGCDVCFPGCLC